MVALTAFEAIEELRSVI